jgi:VanZ family protein
MGLIFYLSSIPDLNLGSSNVTLEVVARKFGHLAEYAILLWFIWRIFYYSWNLELKDSLILAILTAFFYAASDEFHQTFIVGRSGQIIDVIFDLLSALLAAEIIVVKITARVRKITVFIILIITVSISALTWRMIEDGKKIEAGTVIFSSPSPSSQNQENTNVAGNNENNNVGSTDNQSGNININTSAPIPERVLIKVPFTPQAPMGVWDQFHEEACEEASIIMVKYFLDGKTLNKDIAESEIQKMIKFEITKYGDYVDSDARQMVTTAREFYGLNNLKVVYDFKKEDLKKYLAQGKPIIIPAAGQLLGNPNFKYPGPPYHALVMVGYDGNTIITNDPGTRKGEGYRYNIDTLYNAIHDFPGSRDKITEGRKAMIVVE